MCLNHIKGTIIIIIIRSALSSAIVTKFEQLTDSASAVQLVSDFGLTSSFSSSMSVLKDSSALKELIDFSYR